MRSVLHIIYRLDIGGLEKILTDVTNGLVDGYQHTIVSLTFATDESKALLDSSVSVHELNKKEGNDFSLWIRLYKLIRSVSPDVLQTYNLPTLEYQVLGFISRVEKRIHAEHGWDSNDPSGLSSKYALLRRIVNPLVHTWVVVSTDLADWLRQTIRVPGSKTVVIKNGIDTQTFDPERWPDEKSRPDRLEGFANSESYVIGTIGRLDPVKNQRLLLEVMTTLKEQALVPDGVVKLAIVGSGALEADLRAEIRQRDLDSVVWLPGARYNVAEQLSGFDLFVLPSIAEGIPVTLLEAMSMQVPVVVSGVGGIPEVVEHNKSGTLVPSNNCEALVNAVVSHFHERSWSRQIAQAGRKRVLDLFSNSQMILEYDQLYQDKP